MPQPARFTRRALLCAALVRARLLTTEAAAMQPNLISSAQDCDLRAGVQPGSQSFTLGYEFRNRSPRTAFLFNRVARQNAAGRLEPNEANVYITVSGATVILAKKIIPVPADRDVEKPEVPYVTRVDSGQVFREKFDIPLPLKPWTPYPGRAPQPGFELEAWFELGFFLAPDPTIARESGENLIIYPFPVEKQQILRAGPLGRFRIGG
jgi:hypothetical protein